MVPAFAVAFSSWTTSAPFIAIQCGGMVIIALLIWALSTRLATLLSRGIDGNITFELRFEEMCGLAFVFVGLYFMIRGFIPLVTELCQLFEWDPVRPSDEYHVTLIRKATQSGIEFGAGILSLAGAPKWARLLAKRWKATLP